MNVNIQLSEMCNRVRNSHFDHLFSSLFYSLFSNKNGIFSFYTFVFSCYCTFFTFPSLNNRLPIFISRELDIVVYFLHRIASHTICWDWNLFTRPDVLSKWFIRATPLFTIDQLSVFFPSDFTHFDTYQVSGLTLHQIPIHAHWHLVVWMRYVDGMLVI